MKLLLELLKVLIIVGDVIIGFSFIVSGIISGSFDYIIKGLCLLSFALLAISK